MRTVFSEVCISHPKGGVEWLPGNSHQSSGTAPALPRQLSETKLKVSQGCRCPKTYSHPARLGVGE